MFLSEIDDKLHSAWTDGTCNNYSSLVLEMGQRENFMTIKTFVQMKNAMSINGIM